MSKLLIVNADDFGLNEGINQGVVRAHHAGLVQSASLMVNMPAAESAACLAQLEPSLEIGLHLNLSEGICIAPPNKVELLANGDGRFLFDVTDIGTSIQRLRWSIDERPGLLDQVITEVVHQAEKFHKMGLALAHLNAHHYLPLAHPRLYEAFIRAAELLGVPFRGLCLPMLELMAVLPESRSQMQDLACGAQVPCPSVSISNLLDTRESSVQIGQYRSLVETRLAELMACEEVSSVELVVHPAESCSHDTDAYRWARELETSLVHSVELRRTIENLGFSIGGYSAL
jgi:predicted glycoside hydrolase/deacetylase ChbG (UPF0249 family)